MSAIPAQVARRYAKALMEIGSEGGGSDALVQEISSIAAAYESSAEMRSALANPLIPHEAKKALLTEIADRLSLGPVAKHTVLLLNDRRRIAALPAIGRVLRELTDAKKGLVRAEVLTAKPLSAEYVEKLRLSLERRTGKKIAVDLREDPTLIAGVVARIGDTIYDGSLRGRLNEIRTQLTN
jgi:F-type H+-transporting ATPase subunit delta